MSNSRFTVRQLTTAAVIAAVYTVLTTLLPIFAKDQVNIENMTNKSRGEYAYSVFDLNSAVDDVVVSELKAVEGVLRVRVLH